MKYFKKIGILLLLLITVLMIVKWNTIALSYHYVQSNKPENVLQYNQRPQNYFKSRLISNSQEVYKFKESNTLISIPETFISGDSIVSTKNYLEATRYESLMVLKDGEIVYENYWNGLTENMNHSAYSITKTITGILVGIAIGEGLIDSKEDLIIKYLPEFKDTWYKDVTIDHCLDMISGVKWENDLPLLIDYLWRWIWNLTSPEDFLMQTEAWHEPGTFRVYNSMDVLMTGLVLKKVIGEKTLSEYIQEKLWTPLGAQDTAYFTYFQENDIENTIFGFSATTRDLAKVGQLYLQKGIWNGSQIVSEDWVNQSFAADRDDNQSREDKSLKWFYDTYGWGYNNFWWIPDDTNGDETFAWGIDGQLIYIDRSKNIVITSFRSNPADYTGYDGHFLNRSMVDFMQSIRNSIE